MRKKLRYRVINLKSCRCLADAMDVYNREDLRAEMISSRTFARTYFLRERLLKSASGALLLLDLPEKQTDYIRRFDSVNKAIRAREPDSPSDTSEKAFRETTLANRPNGDVPQNLHIQNQSNQPTTPKNQGKRQPLLSELDVSIQPEEYCKVRISFVLHQG